MSFWWRRDDDDGDGGGEKNDGRGHHERRRKTFGPFRGCYGDDEQSPINSSSNSNNDLSPPRPGFAAALSAAWTATISRIQAGAATPVNDAMPIGDNDVRNAPLIAELADPELHYYKTQNVHVLDTAVAVDTLLGRDSTRPSSWTSPRVQSRPAKAPFAPTHANGAAAIPQPATTKLMISPAAPRTLLLDLPVPDHCDSEQQQQPSSESPDVALAMSAADKKMSPLRLVPSSSTMQAPVKEYSAVGIATRDRRGTVSGAADPPPPSSATTTPDSNHTFTTTPSLPPLRQVDTESMSFVSDLPTPWSASSPDDAKPATEESLFSESSVFMIGALPDSSPETSVAHGAAMAGDGAWGRARDDSSTLSLHKHLHGATGDSQDAVATSAAEMGSAWGRPRRDSSELSLCVRLSSVPGDSQGAAAHNNVLYEEDITETMQRQDTSEVDENDEDNENPSEEEEQDDDEEEDNSTNLFSDHDGETQETDSDYHHAIDSSVSSGNGYADDSSYTASTEACKEVAYRGLG